MNSSTTLHSHHSLQRLHPPTHHTSPPSTPIHLSAYGDTNTMSKTSTAAIFALGICLCVDNNDALQFVPSSKSFGSSLVAPYVRTRGSARSYLDMKRPQKKLNKIRKRTSGSDSSGGEVPANLRRKVRAPRPSMGHVVPSAGAQRGKTDGPKLRPQGKARDAGLNNPSALKILGGIARGRRWVFSVV